MMNTTASALDQRRREKAERRQRLAHIPEPAWANWATEGWFVTAGGEDVRCWDLSASETSTGCNGDGSATARIVGTRRDDARRASSPTATRC